MKCIPVVTVGGLPIAVEDCDQAARTMINHALDARGKDEPPLYVTSANGQVLSMCASKRDMLDLFMDADIIHADGAPLVLASRYFCKQPLPERVATTDLVHNTAQIAQSEQVSFYFLGASLDQIEKATQTIRNLYPDLVIAGYRDGYFGQDEEDAVIDRINQAAPDILWIGMGVPREQQFVSRNRAKLTGVGVIKTSGGLFDFLSGKNSRAPNWMQKAGLEWAYRVYLEPKRLFWRYLTTNPHAAWLLLTRSR